MGRLRQLIRNTVLHGLGTVARPSPSIHILNGHMISRRNPHPDVFEEQLVELKKHVRFIRIEEAVSHIANHEVPDEPLVAFTFDDGFDECSTMIAPVLERFGVNGMFFINPGFVEGTEDYIKHFTDVVTCSPGKRPMRWDAIKNLHQRGHVIGAHTMNHYMINDDEEARLEYEIGACKGVIEDKLSAPCEHFAFPYGRMEHANQFSIDIAAKYYKWLYSQSDYRHYFSFNGRVINRRHFEPDWPVGHILYFIGRGRSY